MKVATILLALLFVAIVSPNVSQGCNSQHGIENIDNYFNAEKAIGVIDNANISNHISNVEVKHTPIIRETLAPTFVIFQEEFYFDKGNTRHLDYDSRILQGYRPDKANPPNS